MRGRRELRLWDVSVKPVGFFRAFHNASSGSTRVVERRDAISTRVARELVGRLSLIGAICVDETASPRREGF